MNEDKKLRVAIYCRTGNINDGNIYSQKTELQKYCERKGYELYKCYIDNGFNGLGNNNLGYKMLIEDLKRKRFDLIMARDFFKLCWSSLEYKKFVSLLKENNCNYITVNDNYDFKNDYKKFLKGRNLKNEK